MNIEYNKAIWPLTKRLLQNETKCWIKLFLIKIRPIEFIIIPSDYKKP